MTLILVVALCSLLFAGFVVYSNRVLQWKFPLESYVGLDFDVNLRRVECQCFVDTNDSLLLFVNASGL